MWYDVNRTLSHNCLFNFVVGPRGVGKTYSSKERVLKNFVRDGEQFVYLRRYETEIKPGKMNLLFNDVKSAENHVIEVKGGTFYCDDEVMGYALCLSKAAQYKSIPFPDVTVIIFDEFIIDQGMVRYLDNEVETFCEMYSTIARLRDVKVLFLSNAITVTNPYFIYFDIKPDKDREIIKKGDILVQMVESIEYSKAATDTRFGKLIMQKKYGEYAINNEFLNDNDNFICKMPGNAKCRAIIRADSLKFGLYTYGNRAWIISEKYDKTCNLDIALSNKEHDESAIMTDDPRAKSVWLQIKQKYYSGDLRFTSIRAKNIVASKLINIWR